MNEIRDLIVGIDFGKEYSQICYYDRKGDEARSLSMKAGGNQYESQAVYVTDLNRRITVWVWRLNTLPAKRAES